MPWYLRSMSDKDTHRGVPSRDSVLAECGIRFQPLRVAFARTALSSRPHDPGQVCPTCEEAEIVR